MGSEFWYMCPIWFIPASCLWTWLNIICDDHCLTDCLSKRFGWRKRDIEKWQMCITGVVAYVGSLAIIILISILIGFDLLNWEPM